MGALGCPRPCPLYTPSRCPFILCLPPPLAAPTETRAWPVHWLRGPGGSARSFRCPWTVPRLPTGQCSRATAALTAVPPLLSLRPQGLRLCGPGPADPDAEVPRVSVRGPSQEHRHQPARDLRQGDPPGTRTPGGPHPTSTSLHEVCARLRPSWGDLPAPSSQPAVGSCPRALREDAHGVGGGWEQILVKGAG